MQPIVWYPTCFKMNLSTGRPAGGAALLLTNQAVASNVPFAAKYPPRVVVSRLAGEVYYCNSLLLELRKLIAVKRPIGNHPIPST
jgi:hypothetical protein